MTNQTDIKNLRAALALLESGRGVPVHLETLPNMAARWARFEDQIRMRQAALEAGSLGYVKESLQEDIGNGPAAINTLLRMGAYGSDTPAVVGVAYRDSVEWFENTRASFWAAPPEDLDELVERAHVTFQKGLERLYDIAENTIVIPELSNIGVVPDDMPDERKPFHLDPKIAAQRLREVLTERLGLPEVPQRELPGGNGLELGGGL